MTALALLAGSARAIAESASFADSFRKDFEVFTRGQNRLCGREEGSLAAAHHVEQRLRAMGITNLFVQEFRVVVPRMTECELETEGQRYSIWAMRPNLVQAAVTPAEGIGGLTVYAGKGQPEDYGHALPEGRIVCLDFDCGNNWLTAFAFGATAVLFLENPGSRAQPYHHINLPADLPRFYVPADLVEKLQLRTRSREVRIFGACTWESSRGRNVIAEIQGTNAVFNAKRPRQRETIVLAASLDTLSEVPDLSVGAREAANAAALLQIAEFLVKNPPSRDVILAFFDGQAQNHLGARRFYGALYRKMGIRELTKISLEERLRMLEEEQAFLRAAEKVLEHGDLFTAPVAQLPGYLDAVRMVRREVRRVSDEAMQELAPLRIALQKLKHSENRNSLEVIAELERLQPEGPRLGLIDRLALEDLAWNAVLRAFSEGRPIRGAEDVQRVAQRLVTDRDPERARLKREFFCGLVPQFLGRAVEMTRQSCRRRLQEVEFETEMARQDLELTRAFGEAHKNIVLHIAINLSDGGTGWSFIHGDYSSPFLDNDIEGIYSGIYKAIRQVHEVLAADVSEFDPRPVSDLYSTVYSSRLFVPALFADSTAIARDFAKYNLSVMAVMDPMPKQGLPEDRPEIFDLERFARRIPQAAQFILSLAAHEGLSRDYPYTPTVYYEEAVWTGWRASGRVVRQSDVGDPMRSPSVPDAIVAAVPARNTGLMWEEADVKRVPPGFVWEMIAMTRSDGLIELPPVSRSRRWSVIAATFDKKRETDATQSARSSTRGLIGAITTQQSLSTSATQLTVPINIVKVRPRTFVGYGYERLIRTTALHAISSSEFMADRHLVCENENVLALFAPYETRMVKLFNPYGMVLLRNELTRKDYQGAGILVERPFEPLVCARETAHDLHTLNAYRLNLLRENQIGEESLEVLHGRAGDLQEDARHWKDESAARYHGTLESSASFSRRAYKPLVAVMNDLVTAVVFLLLLAIPFAFAIERLVVGTPHIYRRIAWFGFFFAVTFAVLFTVNPAFKLAATPAIIFLAFAIMLLSALVIFIMLRKLETEMKKLQGLSVSAHTVDVSRFSTMSAAVSMGISTMRRRPLRTILTTITVVLVTFTILTFASFSSVWGNRQRYIGPMSDSVPRIFVRHPLWNPVSQEVCGTLRGYLAERAEVVPTWWVAPILTQVLHALRNKETPALLLALPDGSRAVPLACAVGMDPAELRLLPKLADCFTPGSRLDLLESDGIFLPKVLAEKLGLTEADVGAKELLVGSQRLRFAGWTAERIALQSLLDGSSILPVDYKTSMAGQDPDTFQIPTVTEGADAGESASFTTFGADAAAIVPASIAREMGARIRAVTIYPRRVEEVERMANEVSIITTLPTYVGKEGGVYRLYFSKLIAASGFKDLVIPVLLGGLIIFATMLGSVADREREIYTFSSLGLAPAHVAMLFFAEAAVYAVVGGVGGYLLGQIAAKVLAFAARLGLFTVPSMNFSSLNAVATIFVVMGIVLLSSAYPAIKAARSANPGIQRMWKLPKPMGDVFDISFPFTVSEYDLTGIVSYLEEHFRSFTDTSIGVFATLDCRILRQAENNMLGFSARVALAPYDLGIEQSFLMLSQPSDVEGIDEVRVLLRRTSGTYGDWQRANRVFINDLRRQFLIWRTLDAEVMKRYRAITLERWERLPVQSRVALLAEFQTREREAAPS
ncbi:MAG: FtsX-like permease family protein [Kiritimatiellia bacterium]